RSRRVRRAAPTGSPNTISCCASRNSSARRPRSPAARCMASRRGGKSSLLKRAVWLVVAVVAIIFGVEGGEFGTFDLVRNRRGMAQLQHANDPVQHGGRKRR